MVPDPDRIKKTTWINYLDDTNKVVKKLLAKHPLNPDNFTENFKK